MLPKRGTPHLFCCLGSYTHCVLQDGNPQPLTLAWIHRSNSSHTHAQTRAHDSIVTIIIIKLIIVTIITHHTSHTHRNTTRHIVTDHARDIDRVAEAFAVRYLATQTTVECLVSEDDMYVIVFYMLMVASMADPEEGTSVAFPVMAWRGVGWLVR